MLKEFTLTITAPNGIPTAIIQRQAPPGVRLSGDSPPMHRGYDVSLTVTWDLKITVDLTQVAWAAVVAWLSGRRNRGSSRVEMKVNGKELPADSDSAIKLLEETVARQNAKEDLS
jgi:hypothetical protein